jgi:hypothetical protein
LTLPEFQRTTVKTDKQEYKTGDTVSLPLEKLHVTEHDDPFDLSNVQSKALLILKQLGAGRGLTPFTPYPTQLNPRATQLLDHCMLNPSQFCLMSISH